MEEYQLWYSKLRKSVTFFPTSDEENAKKVLEEDAELLFKQKFNNIEEARAEKEKELRKRRFY